MSTEAPDREALERWLDEVAIPDGFEAELLTGIRRRRLARARRGAAVTIVAAACVALLAAGLPWPRLAARLHLGAAVPARKGEIRPAGVCPSVIARDPAPTAAGLQLRIGVPATVRTGRTVTIQVTLSNEGRSPLSLQLPPRPTLCLVRENGTVAGLAVPVVMSGETAAGPLEGKLLSPGSAPGHGMTWNLGACVTDAAHTKGCTPDGSLRTGTYRVFAILDGRLADVSWQLVSEPAQTVVVN
jgi:hypothetical protein